MHVDRLLRDGGVIQLWDLSSCQGAGGGDSSLSVVALSWVEFSYDDMLSCVAPGLAGRGREVSEWAAVLSETMG
jgi:hypothetical protein